MTINRYSPNPHLIAPSTEQRMILAADGDYVRVDELMEALKPGTKQIVLCLKCNDTGCFPIGSSSLCNHIYPALEIDQSAARQTLAMKKALEDIKRHIEFIMPDDYKKSAIWRMAVKGLDQV